jgi:hypothetical protein
MEAFVATAPTDPVALVRQIKPDHIRHRLRALEAERQALLVLLRAARAISRPEPEEARRA